jgi:acyl-CoA thioesterase-1
VIAFGDSITSGLYLSADEAYPARLAALLGLPVCNAGSLGDTTATAMLRFTRDVLQFHPSVVLLLFGTNDSGVTAHDGRAPVALGDYRTALADMVRQARAVGAVPVLLSLPPTDPARSAPGGTGSGGWATYDAAVRAVAALNGVQLIDLAAAFGGDLSLLRDGIHPTPDGALAIAKAAAPVVRVAIAGR